MWSPVHTVKNGFKAISCYNNLHTINHQESSQLQREISPAITFQFRESSGRKENIQYRIKIHLVWALMDE